MKIPTIILFIFIFFNMHAQDFSFTLFFEDSDGNKDSLVLGAYNEATQYYDPSLGEYDIKFEPLDTVFEVRTTNATVYTNFETISDYDFIDSDSSFESKTYFNDYSCYDENYYNGVVSLIIKCKHYPVKIFWDSTIFQDSCYKQTVLTDWHPGGWFDAAYGLEQGVYELDTLSETSFNKPFLKFDHTSGETLDMLFIGFAGLYDFISDTSPKEILLYPVPADNFLTISNFSLSNCSYSIYDITCREILNAALPKSNTVYVQELQKGMYILQVKNRNQDIVGISKFLKL